MSPTSLRRLATLALAALAPSTALAIPVITGISPAVGPANTGAAVVISCTDCGYSNDRVLFPGDTVGVTPLTWSLNSYVTVRVPPTWSGDVRLKKQGGGPLSNAWNHDISFSWSAGKWLSLPFTWRLNSAAAPGCTFNETRDALIAGYDAWECASGLNTTFGGSTPVGAYSNDGISCFFWRPGGWSPNQIAVAVWWIDSGEIVEADVGFNSQHFTWSCSGASGAMDVQNIGTHEQGHTIGLLDLYGSADASKTMFGTSSVGLTNARSPEVDDVIGAEFMYPHARANFAATTPTGWHGPLVPRNTADATNSSAPLPTVLTGNSTTYVNLAASNLGADCASSGGSNELRVDDQFRQSVDWASWNPGVVLSSLNFATSVPGGRHTLREDLDVGENVLESSELDNWTESQFVWSPLPLATGAPQTRLGPPLNGPFPSLNCDGMEYTAAGYWAGIAAMPNGTGTDYDVLLFDDYVNSTTGFSTVLAPSYSGGTAIDYVLWNGNHGSVGPDARRFAGITQYEPGTPYAGLVVVEAGSQLETLAPGSGYGSSDSYSADLSSNQLFKILEVYLGSTATTYRFELIDSSGTAEVDFRLYDAHAPYFDKNDAIASSVTTGADESFDFKPAATGWYAVVVAKRNHEDLGRFRSFTVRVGAALSDLRSDFTPAGWSSPVVPRNTTGASVGSALLTSVLNGNTAPTYFNFSTRQVGVNATPGSVMHQFIDDEFFRTGVAASGSATTTWIANNSGPYYVRGGRHSVTNVADALLAVDETDETNNSWTGQWVWSPLDLVSGNPLLRAAPPDDGSFAQPNADGFRYSHAGTNAWVVASAATTPLDDYDLWLYADYVSSTSGYSDLRKASMQGSNGTDFVVGHYTSSAPVYPAVVRYMAAGGAGFFVADQITSSGRVAGSIGNYTSQALTANRLADVYEMNLDAGQAVHMLLHRVSGSSNLAFAVFPPTTGGMHARAEGVPSLVLDADDDTLRFKAETSGWHPVVVYRTTGDVAGTPVTYDLRWGLNVVVDVPATAATPLAFAGASPNPVADRARFAFSLSREGEVTLELFDLSGRRIRGLVQGRLGAGHHTIEWDRSDDDGGPAKAGVYWSRLTAEGRSLTRRVSVLE